MDNKIQYINSIFKDFAQEIDSEEYNTFFTLLRGIKNCATLLDYYGDEFIENLMELLPRIEDKYDKASVIEAIVEGFYTYKFNEYYRNEILNEYVLLLKQDAASVNNAVMCLRGFMNSGISQSEIFMKIAESLEKRDAITILSQIGITEWGNVTKELSQLLEEVQEAYNIRWRSIIIGQFLLLVNPLCRHYGEISEITFVYKSYKGVYDDCCPRGLLNFKDTLIKTKVLSLKEIRILEKLDELLNEKQLDLDSMEVRKLYYDFFEGKDPFDVIFTLPRNPLETYSN